MVMPTAGLFDSEKVVYDANDGGPLDRNPNGNPASLSSLNPAADGPFSKLMSEDGSGNYNGKTEGPGFSGGANGYTYYFK